MSSIQFKRGASFSPRITYTPPEGALPNLTDVAITSQIRARGRLLADLVVEDMNEEKTAFTLIAPAGTDAWPTGLAEWDIRFSIGGVVFYSDTALLEITSSVTAP